jgi:hypothetical protein
LVDRLTDQMAATLLARTRSNGREQNAWLAWDRIAGVVIDMYRDVLSGRPT